MADPSLPKWVWDLVIALQQYEDVHDQQAGCLKSALDAVPGDVLDRAEAIADYARQAIARVEPVSGEEQHHGR